MCVLADADKVLLDGNHAKTFLGQKRNMWKSHCDYMQWLAESMREQRVGPFEFTSNTADLYEECCDEGCNTSEMAENVHPVGYSDRAEVRTNINILYRTFSHFN